MKTIIYILPILIILSGSIYLFNQQTEKEQSLQAFERNIEFNNGHLRWNLRDKDLDDYKVRSIAKSIKRGLIKDIIGDKQIHSLYLDLSYNKQPFNFKPILEAINNSSKFNKLSLIEIDFQENYQTWDQNFEGYSFPSDLYTIKFIGSLSNESSVTNLTKAISNCKNLRNIFINLHGGNFTNVNELLQVVSQFQYLENISFGFGFNPIDFNNEEFRDYIYQIFQGPNVYEIFLQIGNLYADYIEDIEEIFYERFKSGQYQKVGIVMIGDQIDYDQVNVIFGDLKRKFYDQFNFIAKYLEIE